MNQFFKNIAKDYRPSSPCKVSKDPEAKSPLPRTASPRRKLGKRYENTTA